MSFYTEWTPGFWLSLEPRCMRMEDHNVSLTARRAVNATSWRVVRFLPCRPDHQKKSHRSSASPRIPIHWYRCSWRGALITPLRSVNGAPYVVSIYIYADLRTICKCLVFESPIMFLGNWQGVIWILEVGSLMFLCFENLKFLIFEDCCFSANQGLRCCFSNREEQNCIDHIKEK